MEKRINNKARSYFQTFKDDIKDNILELGISKKQAAQLLQYIYDYQPIEFEKTDFQKRKRIKNVVPFYERCCALRANNEQCTRRRKGEAKFCGTHIKGTPHGEINQTTSKPTHLKKTVQAVDIKGIIYYIDDDCNVYDPQDIIENNKNPKIIAKYVKEGDTYRIPSLFKNKKT